MKKTIFYLVILLSSVIANAQSSIKSYKVNDNATCGSLPIDSFYINLYAVAIKGYDSDSLCIEMQSEVLTQDSTVVNCSIDGFGGYANKFNSVRGGNTDSLVVAKFQSKLTELFTNKWIEIY